MEHRDRSRINAHDAPSAPASDDDRRVARLGGLATATFGRRIFPGRPILASVIGVTAVALTLWLCALGYHRLVRYVHTQPDYQLMFREITLVPEPPSWYRGGRDAFLDDIPRGGALNPGPFSVLDLDAQALDRLSKLLKRNPVVKRVTRLEVRHPSAVVAWLDYRDPVAIAHGKNEPDAILDGDGVFLPTDRVEKETAETLIQLKRSTFSPPVNPRIGETWNRSDTGDGANPTRPDERVIEAARLAAFLKVKLAQYAATDASSTAGRVRITLQNIGEHGFWVQWGDRVFFQWGNPRAGEVPNDAKWEMMLQWLRDNPAPRAEPVHLGFSPKGVVPVSVK